MNLKNFNDNKTSIDDKLKKDQTKDSEYKKYAGIDVDQILKSYDTTKLGLSNNEARKRLLRNGKNIVGNKKKIGWYVFLFKSFIDEFIIVLIILSIVSMLLGEKLGAVIICILALISGLVRFVQEYTSYLADQKLKNMIHSTTEVRRGSDNDTIELNIEDLVEGDIIELGAGSIIPADLRIIENKDLFVSQSIFTGESVPVEKYATLKNQNESSVNLDNICFMGSNVVSGSAVGLVIKTGKNTYLGDMAKKVSGVKEVTNFEIGIKKITNLLIRYMIVIVLFVFFINGIFKQDWLQALLFAVSVAVGITPGMLPMIVNVNLSKGAQFLAKKKTIVKNINSIQNLGAIDTLCTDKTGTLTIDKVVLQKYMNVEGEEDLKVLDYAFLNSYYSTGIKNLIDRAIIEYGVEHKLKDTTSNYSKIDEIPFDYERKKMSIVVKTPKGKYKLITKGALEEVLKICTTVKYNEAYLELTKDMIDKINQNVDKLHEQGMHIIAIAEKREYPGVGIFDKNDENEMTFIGYVAFLDPPKKDARKSLDALEKIGIRLKVLTGDSGAVTKNICNQVGIDAVKVITGSEIETMSDEDLKIQVESVDIFARLSPIQKARVVRILRQNGHVVGYMGDGVNDAPSLREADVGISVDSASDIAKESSDIILLKKSLMVLKDGVLEGRRIYGNIMKYMKMALSSNVGNVFSVLVGSIFLPFLPMIPIQILIQNLIYDMSQIAIPFDNVDSEFLKKPKKWDTNDLKHFMNVFGVVSSIFDMVTFLILWYVFGFNSVSKQQYFQTGWFIEGLISQCMVVHFIRTEKIPFIESTANKLLLLSTTLSISLAIFIPYIFNELKDFNFAILPVTYYIYLVLIIFAYALLVQLVKKAYVKKYKAWL